MLLERAMNRAADAVSLGTRSEIKQPDLAAAMQQSDTGEASVALGDDAEVVGVFYPGQEVLWRLIGEPMRERAGIIVMISRAELGD